MDNRIDNDFWYDLFLDKINQKYPQKPQLAEALMDLLYIERESAYRRLRKEVLFPPHELVKIAREWNISLDDIVGITASEVPFQMKYFNYSNPSDHELKEMRKSIQKIKQYKDSNNDLEYMEICNKLPRSISSGFAHLARFFIYKWMYQYNNDYQMIPFSQMVIPPKLNQIKSEYYSAMKNLTTCSYIWDHMLFEYLVWDIRYFCSIRLVSEEDKELIKADLHTLLHYMMEVATKGVFPETQKKAVLFISQVHISTNYSYFYANDWEISRIHAFTKYEIFTTNPELASNFRNWMQIKKKAANQISEVNEKGRIEFFTQQHQIVDSL